MFLKKLLLPLAVIVFPLLGVAQTEVKPDTANKISRPAGKPRPYKEVITAKAVTDSGLFIVHRVEDRYYFEIPDSLLDTDILTVNRISKAAADVRPQGGFYGYAGDLIGENVVQFSKGPNNKIFIKQISYSERSTDSSENGMYRSVLNSNLQPIIAAFDIKAFTLNSMGVIIDVTDYINGDNDVLFFDGQVKKAFGIGAIQADKSYIARLNSFPENIEITTIKTFTAEGNAKTFELNSSIILLPRHPMKPRLYDPRVGYFSTGYKNFDANPQGIENTLMITRWRLEPKNEDIEKYKRGELVEPQKPIVFYIDPTTPKKWVPYLIQGVNDWQKAFEKAGFKNAIYALEAPKNDPEWSLEDARHNAIIYKPSTISNAYGPHVHDPRTGEILETHVQWFHNVMELVHDWYMVQAGAIDPKARKMEFDDSLMGQLIRFVSSHEIGHTLGLTHNFGSSSTVPVDSLRNKRWVEANGHTPSIMDYARFNYVAQPEDNISENGIFPRIGVYDDWAIEWGYKWLPDFKKSEEETFMNQWTISRLEKDKRLWYGPQPLFGLVSDPRCQSEDLGDDAMKASYYGIQNLKRIEARLIEWTRQSNKNFGSLKRMNQQVAAQFYRYLMHVANNIGKYYYTEKTIEQRGTLIDFIPKEKQKEAVKFLCKQLFQPPLWLLNNNMFSFGAGYNSYVIGFLQSKIISSTINIGTYINLSSFKEMHPKEAYTFDNLLTDFENEIWNELKTKTPINLYRRNLQKIYVEQLIETTDLTNPTKDQIIAQSVYFKTTTDYIPLIQHHIRSILKEISKVIPFYKDQDTKSHLIAMKNRLRQILDPNASLLSFGQQTANQEINGIEIDNNKLLYFPFYSKKELFNISRYQGCWEEQTLDFLKPNNFYKK